MNYEKPTVKKVQLVANEAVLANCKTAGNITVQGFQTQYGACGYSLMGTPLTFTCSSNGS